MAPSHRVYVIQNAAGKFYIGVTGNIENRLAEHNTGRSRWTKTKGPWHVVWKSDPMSLSAARKLENNLKRQGRGRGFYSLTGLRKFGS